jgi:hypothetical protein
VLLRPFATSMRHILAALSMAALPQSSRKRPANFFVAVTHRGTWFYVDDRDHVSKRFFNGIYDLFNMEITPSGGGGGGQS